jgi:putative ABC transport system substrate-binding protein
MNRRDTVLALLALVAATAPIGVQAQALRRIGTLAFGERTESGEWGPHPVFYAALVNGMKELGYVEGRDYVIERRFWGGQPERIQELARELVQANVDVIVAYAPQSIEAARSVTDRVPIVMVFSVDPFREGRVKSLGRPGGNVTGLTWDVGLEFWPKHLELLKEALPKLRRVAYLWTTTNPAALVALKRIEDVAPGLGVSVISAGVKQPSDFEAAFTRMRKASAEALVMVVDPLTVAHRNALMALATREKLPTLATADRGFPDVLIVFGAHVADIPSRAAGYVVKILKGAKPGDLPIEQPTKFDLIVNLKVARALGITIPQTVLFRADRVIE